MVARKRSVRIKQMPNPHKDKAVQHTMSDLTAAARDAIQETLAHYLASPDTLRNIVKEEIGRHIRYEMDGIGADRTILDSVAARARELAIEEFNKPENFDLMVEQLKERYLSELKINLQERIKSRASLDAHDAYQRAWRSYDK